MLRSLRVRTGRGRFNPDSDGGFSLIEVIVALSILVIVMLTTAGFFVSSLKNSAGQAQQQQAAQLASQQLEYTRSVPAKDLLYGRTQADVVTATTAPAPGITDLTQDVLSGFNYDGWDGHPSGQTSQVVPLSQTQAVAGVTYTIKTFIDRCYVNFGANQQCVRGSSANSSWLFRITVNVSWQLGGGRSCPTASKQCQFVASTLRDPSSDPCFNVNVDFSGCSLSQPIITTISPSTVTTRSSTNMLVTGVNFDPGAKVTIDTDTGTISNVVVLSTTQISFTLTTFNTPDAVGKPTIRVTNLNGKFALGTVTVTTSTLNAGSIAPTSVNTGSTTTLVISGSGFQTGGTTVSIPATAGTINGNPVVTANSISLSFTAATTSAALGTKTVTVSNPDGATDTATFTIRQAPITFTTINPATIIYKATRAFVLGGTGFVRGATVTLDGAGVAETWVSSTVMTVALTSDPSVSSSHTFLITNPDGASASKTFSVTSGMSITGISPDPTNLGISKVFVVTGTGFASGIDAKVTGATVTKTQLNSSTQVTVTVSGYPGVGVHTVTLTNDNGTSDTDTFTVVSPVISNVNPDSVKKSSRATTTTTFTITGTNFLGNSATVMLSDDISKNITATSVSSNSITFEYAVGTSKKNFSVNVQVKMADGTLSNVYPWTLKVTN